MRAGTLIAVAVCLFATFAPGISSPAAAGKIDAVRGKQYAITKQHGPWMIMVASFHDRPRNVFEVERGGDINRVPNERFREGMSAADAAAELVYELRRRGIPAYAFHQQASVGTWNTIDRQGQMDRRLFRAQDDRIVVLAGNYESIDQPVAQKTLKYIKKLKPEHLDRGGVYSRTPGRPGPLSGAFLTINPRLDPDEVSRRQRMRDPLILRLNSGVQHSLFHNPGKYTLAIAKFRGESVTTFGAGSGGFQVDDSLDKAAEDAQELAQFLNNHDTLKQSNLKAYVYHDRYESTVTVGSFETPADAVIEKLRVAFGPKMKPDPITGARRLQYESIAIYDGRGNPVRTWPLDPELSVIPVPRR